MCQNNIQFISPKDYAEKFGLTYDLVTRQLRELEKLSDNNKTIIPNQIYSNCFKETGRLPFKVGRAWRIPVSIGEKELPAEESENEKNSVIKQQFLGICFRELSEIYLNPNAKPTDFQLALVDAFGTTKS